MFLIFFSLLLSVFLSKMIWLTGLFDPTSFMPFFTSFASLLLFYPTHPASSISDSTQGGPFTGTLASTFSYGLSSSSLDPDSSIAPGESQQTEIDFVPIDIFTRALNAPSLSSGLMILWTNVAMFKELGWSDFKAVAKDLTPQFHAQYEAKDLTITTTTTPSPIEVCCFYSIFLSFNLFSSSPRLFPPRKTPLLGLILKGRSML